MTFPVVLRNAGQKARVHNTRREVLCVAGCSLPERTLITPGASIAGDGRFRCRVEWQSPSSVGHLPDHGSDWGQVTAPDFTRSRYDPAIHCTLSDNSPTG